MKPVLCFQDVISWQLRVLFKKDLDDIQSIHLLWRLI